VYDNTRDVAMVRRAVALTAKSKNKGVNMQFSPAVLDEFFQAASEQGYHLTRAQFEERVREIVAQVANPTLKGKGSFGGPGAFSPSKAIRGIIFKAKPEVNSLSENSSLPVDREGDIAYAEKTLLTGTTPGSFLVPTIQADTIISLLASANVIRAAGQRVWPMNGIQKLNVPVALAAPNIVWGNSAGTGAGGQGQALVPSDPNLGQVSFDLKSAKSLTAIPNELLATSVPAIDQIISEILALAFAQAEMNANVATTTGVGMPTPVYAAAGTTVVLANGGNVNGGAPKYQDLLAVVGQFYAQKGKGKPAWFMHPTVFYKDIMGILDTNGRPIVTGQDNVEQAFMGKLLGFPVYVSAEFPTNQAVGSGSGQSYAIFTNPQYLHIATPGSLELSVSFERFFDSNETAVRGVDRLDFAYAPSQAIVLLQGITV
jgi:HK97 family phage major capsid protein